MSLKLLTITAQTNIFKPFTKFSAMFCSKKDYPPDQQAMLDEAQAKGTIDYLQTSDPVGAVHDIVMAVAIDPPIDMVTRLISSFQKVTSCRRQKK